MDERGGPARTGATDRLAALRTPAGAALLAEVADRGVADEDLLATTTALRAAGHAAEAVAAAVDQVRLRARARAKFGADAELMVFTAAGLEQATRASVATARAARLAGHLSPGDGDHPELVDLCCGIGGDLVALARAGLRVHGVDADPLTAAVAAANVEALGIAGRATVACADVTTLDLGGYGAAFCDPGRRSGGRRVFDPDAYRPPWSFLLDVAAQVPRTVLKVAPGIPHERVPVGVEAEWVSDGGDVKEAALWCGDLATAARRATLLPAGVTLTGSGDELAPVGPLQGFLYDPDGAVVRAHLVAELAGRLGATAVSPDIAYLTAGSLVPTPFARAYAVREVLPFSLKRLRALLRARGVGRLTVKKRGSAVEPEQLRRDLRLSGDAEATVVLTRVAGAPTAIVCDPV